MMVGYEAAIDFHNKIGHEKIVGRIKELGDYLRKGLMSSDIFEIHSSVHPDMCAGLTTYGVKGVSGKDLQTAMWEKAKLQPRPVGPDQKYIRYSTHFYNSKEEIDKALEVAKKMV
jgi:selenocysteine lyase/cysteine desulfurase